MISLALGLIVWAAAASAGTHPPTAGTGEVLVSLAFRGELSPGSDTDRPVDWGLTLQADAPEVDPERIVTSGRLGDPVRLVVRKGTLYSLDIEMPGYWVESSPVLVPMDREEPLSITVTLHPTGRLRGRFELAADAEPATELTARLSATIAGAFQPEEPIRCTVDGLAWHCDLPEGRYDIRLRVPGSPSLFLWDHEVAAGSDGLRAVPFSLRPGASLVGWVQTDDGSSLPPDVTVFVERQEAVPGRDPSSVRRQRLLDTKIEVDERGFFELSGIEQGSYRLTVEGSGYVPGVLEPVRVIGTSETEVRRLTLHRPATLELLVPPLGDPLVQSLHARLIALGPVPGAARLVETGELDAAGGWTASGLTPTRHMLQIVTSDGDVLHHEEIELETGSNPWTVHLDLVPLEGLLSLGDQPLPARITFGGPGSTSRVKMVADAEGEFSGLLPREGVWTIRVDSIAPPLSKVVRDVEVRRSGSRRVANVEIRLPDGTVRGSVVDPAGQPVPGADLSASDVRGGGGFANTTADEQGNFELLGLPEGTWIIHAEARQGTRRQSSEVVSVVLEDGERIEGVQVVIRPTRRLSGLLVGESGPVSGALIQAAVQGTGVATGATARSEVDGRFDLELPASGGEVFLIVMAPGHALHGERLAEDRLGSGEDVTDLVVRINDEGGTVTLAMPLAVDWNDPAVPKPVLLRADAVFDWATLVRWASLRSGARSSPGSSDLVLPAVEAGDYVACWLPPDASIRLTDLPLTSEVCASGFLAPRGTLELELSDPGS